MNPYRPEAPPFDVNPVLVDWVLREHTAIERSLSSVHDLDPIPLPTGKPQIGAVRYFTAGATEALWGEGPYVYMERSGLTLWFPMFPPEMNDSRVTIDPGVLPILIVAAWTPILSAQITQRPLSRVNFKGMFNAQSQAANQNVDIEYRLLVNGVENADPFRPFWYHNTNTPSVTPQAGQTTTIVGFSPLYQPPTPVTQTSTITVEARAYSVGQTEVLDGFLHILEQF